MVKVLLSIFFMLLLCGSVNALSFGSSAQSYFITVGEDKDATFKLLFWSEEGQAQRILLSAISKPPGFSVNVVPEIIVGPEEGNEMIYISGKYLRSTAVNVDVRTNSAVPDIYTIIVSAKSVPSDDDIPVIQERIFDLKLRISGSMPDNADNSPEIIIDWDEEDNKILLYLAIIIIVGFISIIIYKYS